MNIIVLIKQVPDTTEIKIDPKTGNLIREGVESIINPDDRHAIEVAITLKQELGGKTTALSMGPPQAIDAVSEALGMGIDQGILLTDKNFAGADTWATAYTLGKAIRKIKGYDLVICGRQAIDGDTAQIGPQIAEFLNLPQLTYVREIEEIDEKRIVVKRALEDGYERVESPLPALITVLREINRPRHPRVSFLIDACQDKAPIKIWDAADLGVTVQEIGLSGSLTRVIKTFSPKSKREGEILKGDTDDVVSQLIGRLHEKHLV
ncbi:MAG TPA: electron transfer flavoprotein subunit beta/FixA family protein [Desulfatiglandales bacterium]|nr:electron transfer flavoprotein subunit beta/FixA family protein [Desulfatiglandales bacterium]